MIQYYRHQDWVVVGEKPNERDPDSSVVKLAVGEANGNVITRWITKRFYDGVLKGTYEVKNDNGTLILINPKTGLVVANLT